MVQSCITRPFAILGKLSQRYEPYCRDVKIYILWLIVLVLIARELAGRLAGGGPDTLWRVAVQRKINTVEDRSLFPSRDIKCFFFFFFSFFYAVLTFLTAVIAPFQLSTAGS